MVGRDTSERLRDCAAVHGYVERVCFKTGPPGLVGAELEWILAFEDTPREPVPLDLLRSLLHPLHQTPHGSRITYEPGGQLELSSPPFPGATACWQALREDAEYVRRPLADAGVRLVASAIDPYRPPRRQLSHPRYDAMESYFAGIGSAQGPVMMNSTAATQVNLDIGLDPEQARHRWHQLHLLGPVMVAAFANSPVHDGQSTGWRSTRQRVWQHLDPSRTGVPDGVDPWTGWADYALDAQVMLRRREVCDHEDWTVPPGITFRDWVDAGIDGATPTTDDLDLHLTTLFPPVRPRGWYEVRYLDAQAWRWWPVPMAVLTALLDDPVTFERAREACRGTEGLWPDAAREALAVPALATAARDCFDLALTALVGSGEAEPLVALVEDFAAHYVRRGRCPADDFDPILALEVS